MLRISIVLVLLAACLAPAQRKKTSAQIRAEIQKLESRIASLKAELARLDPQTQGPGAKGGARAFNPLDRDKHQIGDVYYFYSKLTVARVLGKDTAAFRYITPRGSYLFILRGVRLESVSEGKDIDVPGNWRYSRTALAHTGEMVPLLVPAE